MPSTSSRKSIAIYLLSLAMSLGISYPLHLHFDLKDSVDAQGYMRMAKGDYSANPYRRNRPVVPIIAEAVAIPIAAIYQKVWPHRNNAEWPLRMGFYIVNALIFAAVLTLVFNLCIGLGCSTLAALIAVLSIACSRWATFIVGLPLTDTFFLLTISLSFHGLWCRKQWPLLLGISLGLLSKEAYILFLPIFFLFGLKVTSFLKITISAAISVMLAIFVRYWVNEKVGNELGTGISTTLSYFETLSGSLQRILSVNGLADIGSAYGLFWLIPLLAAFHANVRRAISQKLGLALPLFALMVLFGAMLAGDISRLIYMGAPVFAVVVGLSVQHSSKLQRSISQ